MTESIIIMSIGMTTIVIVVLLMCLFIRDTSGESTFNDFLNYRKEKRIENLFFRFKGDEEIEAFNEFVKEHS